MNELLLGVVAYTLVRELFFFYQMSKLLNKFMCRNYYEFKTAESLGTIKESVKKEPIELNDELDTLQGIGF